MSLGGIHAAAHPFMVALLCDRFPARAIVAVTAGVKTQEGFHQDLATWLKAERENGATGAVKPADGSPLFYPSWDILPHEPKLPHVDVISERLETLVALADKSPRPDLRSTVTPG